MGIVPGLFRSVLNVLVPAHCVGCGTGGSYICTACLTGAKRPLPEPSPEGGLLADILTAFAYEGVVRTAVQHLKYRGVRALAPEMARPMARELALAVPPPFTIVPVPLHARRLRERGFNQAELLAREVAQVLGAPLSSGALRRTVDTSSQVAATTRPERLRNVRGAFDAVRPLDGTVVLVDDVMTTGATLSSAAQALRSGGALQVYGLTFAHEE